MRCFRAVYRWAHIIDGSIELTLELIRRFEGLRLRPYLCPAGVWTIGYGSTRYENGAPVKPTDSPITAARADAIVIHQLNTDYIPGVLALCDGKLDTPGRMAAIVDFAYNLGVGAFRGSTLRKRILAEQWEDVPHELNKWVRGGGKLLPGLVKRRQAEALLTKAMREP